MSRDPRNLDGHDKFSHDNGPSIARQPNKVLAHVSRHPTTDCKDLPEDRMESELKSSGKPEFQTESGDSRGGHRVSIPFRSKNPREDPSRAYFLQELQRDHRRNKPLGPEIPSSKAIEQRHPEIPPKRNHLPRTKNWGRGQYDSRWGTRSEREQHLWEAQNCLVAVGVGTNYPCSQESLDNYKRRPKRTRKKPWKPWEAVRLLEKHLDLNRPMDQEQSAAMRRLVDGMKIRPWHCDVVIKAFGDLDIAFFKGKLCQRVSVSWCRGKCFHEPDLLGYCSPIKPEGYGRAEIHLNPVEIFCNPHIRHPSEQIWRTTVHEMVVSGLQKLSIDSMN
ncbi:MAG: hypothetical protein Q9190_006349 [Brigantiaea leucoxantha]